MVRKLVGLLALGSIAPVQASARDREPEVLPRSGKWEVNYDADSCRLFGKFGEGDAAVIAQFTRYESGDHFDLVLYGKKLTAFDPSGRIEVKLSFGPGGPRVQKEAFLGDAGKMPMMMFTSLRLDGWKPDSRIREIETPPAVTPTQEAAISDATFEIPAHRPLRLAMGSLGKPMELMRSCQTDLIRHWGYDPAVQGNLSRPAAPTASPASWLHDDDYPRGALNAGNNGVVQFRLDIDPEGKVASCVTLFRTKPDVFGDATCKVITRRARFTPALDAQGKPVRSFYINKVRWLMGS